MNPYSCVQTVELLRDLAMNVHGVIDIIDERNCEDIIELLKKQEGYEEPAVMHEELVFPWASKT